VEQMFEVGIVVSTDTDLVPALETINDSPRFRAWGWPRVETFCWEGLDKSIRPTTSQRIWCCYPNREQYEAVRDNTNYTL
jgi:hypothetical protein